MTTVRRALSILALSLIGFASLTPTLAHAPHGRRHFGTHHGVHLSKPAPAPVSVNPLKENHAAAGNEAAEKGEVKIQSVPQDAGRTLANTEHETGERGTKNNAGGVHPQGAHATETSGAAHENAGKLSGFPGKDSGPVDTRITIVPPSHPGQIDKGHHTKKFSLIGAERHAVPNAAVGGHDRLVPNAIGIAVPARVATSAPESRPYFRPALTNAGTIARPATENGAGMGVKSKQGMDRSAVPAKSGPPVAKSFAPRGAIDGTAIVRRGFAPATVSGQARIAGINGSLIHPKH
jgi:hypothetical protein